MQAGGYRKAAMVITDKSESCMLSGIGSSRTNMGESTTKEAYKWLKGSEGEAFNSMKFKFQVKGHSKCRVKVRKRTKNLLTVIHKSQVCNISVTKV